MAALKGGDVTPSVIEALLTDGARLESDCERGELFLAVASRNALEPGSYDTYFRIVDAIGSDHRHRRVLDALIRKQEMSRELAERIVRSAGAIESDCECATLLVSNARVVPIDERIRPGYEKAAGTIGSAHEYGRAMAALRRTANL